MNIIKGFSKLRKEEKIEAVAQLFPDREEFINEIESFWHHNPLKQKIFEEFSENTVTNFYFPYGIAPNFLIDGNNYMIPMVIEESSVIAAASSSAKFWAQHGGFHTEIVSTTKVGQVHFIWEGKHNLLREYLPQMKQIMLQETRHITSNMVKRGGGILDIELKNMCHEIENYYQLFVTFETVNSMGANFINSCLEEFAEILKNFLASKLELPENERNCEIIMSILSNYTPECLVKCNIECDIEALSVFDSKMSAKQFAWKFEKAIQIAQVDSYRATTHNKGIFNGIDAVALATGNDFRAIEACGHTFAAKNGKYSSLTDIKISDNRFFYELTVPLAIGTVGGLTALHPLAKRSLQMLGNPNAAGLMRIAATVGLANNFSAVKSLITKGIQIGHMKMHLFNILNHFEANEEEKKLATEYFSTRKVSFSEVEYFINYIRQE